MATQQHKSKSEKHTAYWITTGLLALGMFAGGFAQFIHAKFNTDGFIHLGYPLYTMYIIGLWKMIGAPVLLIPGYRLLKEWAYAGFFFLLTGGVMSHIFSGDGVLQTSGSFTFAVLTVVSWYLRPANRRINVSFNKPILEHA
jgi:hypothetical protein